ncbi:MAG: hydrogenase formation protein HypD [Deltaproteobacteria bacterium]|nr:hydrogenase formation protein HypD [Deltaproteobacteria bacterium]MBN2670487.1 hydrogenase formation protein HypD [Deltaproteobacteria bacterium]
MKYIDGYRQGDAGKFLGKRIVENAALLADKHEPIYIMEVCGSHTMAISRFGIRDLLPPNVKLLSGPGCPVCVTDAGYIDAALSLARKDVIIATFGDMVRVPGSKKSLADVRSEGADVRICYSPAQAITLAQENPEREVVFMAIGFETTMAPVTTLIPSAEACGLTNLSLLTAFKLVPPALNALIADAEVKVDAFICPAHVSAIIGAEAYRPYVEERGVPCVVCGFEPLDILYGIDNIVSQFLNGECALVNQYSRVVTDAGNATAQKLFETFLTPVDAGWRGIGVIPMSGMGIREQYEKYDAAKRFGVSTDGGSPDPGCMCGDVLKGKIIPSDCPMFGDACTPQNPVGPCMVSSEGSCAAYFKYER